MTPVKHKNLASLQHVLTVLLKGSFSTFNGAATALQTKHFDTDSYGVNDGLIECQGVSEK